MNERIRQLAEKANIEFTYDPTETPIRAFVECWEDDLEKFAELIVRECVEHLESGVAVPNIEHSRTKTKCIRSIKEHFGVEE
jgi:hypothetical protein